jgi:hypothetical protein
MPHLFSSQPKHAGHGLVNGVRDIGLGVAGGVAALFAAPMVGAQKEGSSGFFKVLALFSLCPLRAWAGSRFLLTGCAPYGWTAGAGGGVDRCGGTANGWSGVRVCADGTWRIQHTRGDGPRDGGRCCMGRSDGPMEQYVHPGTNCSRV